MLLRWMNLLHIARSAFRLEANSAGVSKMGTNANCSSRGPIAFKALLTSTAMRCTIAGGTRAGAMTLNEIGESNFAQPASANVGTFGRRLVFLSTANAVTFPDSIYGKADARSEYMNWRRPASRSW